MTERTASASTDVADPSTSRGARTPVRTVNFSSGTWPDWSGCAMNRSENGLAVVGSKLEPVPVPGCDVCEPCGRDREAARQAGRSLEVRCLNGVIAGHPHGREARA